MSDTTKVIFWEANDNSNPITERHLRVVPRIGDSFEDRNWIWRIVDITWHFEPTVWVSAQCLLVNRQGN